ncbi:hypothetical protein GCM10010405_52240 [Streptomyces macrosporus]|uniref:Uncharacterized protein n=1 Tax=Streptomyces macrosporus TaxID=44032 RepID=A0ABN3KJF3_9ACTN
MSAAVRGGSASSSATDPRPLRDGPRPEPGCANTGHPGAERRMASVYSGVVRASRDRTFSGRGSSVPTRREPRMSHCDQGCP